MAVRTGIRRSARPRLGRKLTVWCVSPGTSVCSVSKDRPSHLWNVKVGVRFITRSSAFPEAPSTARPVAAPGRRVSFQVKRMAEVTHIDIVRRAYQLWQQAGEPEGKDQEFYHLAEQALRNEDKSSPLRTPDNL
jgi:Protein of unknown function (DUF2934)